MSFYFPFDSDSASQARVLAKTKSQQLQFMKIMRNLNLFKPSKISKAVSVNLCGGKTNE